MGRTRTGFTEVYAQSLTTDCDLTFDITTWFLFATHCLVMIIVCAELFLNPTMLNKVMGRIRTGFSEVYAQSLSADCDLDLWPSDMVLVRGTSSCHDNHFWPIIFKSNQVRQSYGPDTILEHTCTHTDRVNSIDLLSSSSCKNFDIS